MHVLEMGIETYLNIKQLCNGGCCGIFKKLCFLFFNFILKLKFEDQFSIIDFRIPASHLSRISPVVMVFVLNQCISNEASRP